MANNHTTPEPGHRLCGLHPTLARHPGLDAGRVVLAPPGPVAARVMAAPAHLNLVSNGGARDQLSTRRWQPRATRNSSPELARIDQLPPDRGAPHDHLCVAL